jgi:hypothetical protein
LNIDDRTLEKILRVGSERAVWVTRARWIDISPDGAIMYLRDHSIHNIHAPEWNADC